MPCNDCSRTEKCPPCPVGQEKPLFAPGAEEYYRKVLGLEPKAQTVTVPQNAFHRCTCGHIKSVHLRDGGTLCAHCGCQAYVCDHTECGWKPREEPHEHAYGYQTGGVYKCTCGAVALLAEPGAEPPLTPEEEEEAPQDKTLEDCVCGHAPEEHEGVMHEGRCHGFQCECPGHRTMPDFELPPQPDRRPPYAVAYSVQGHLFEVALSGDATVRAVDGALVITHSLGPVAGICQVAPMKSEEGA